MGDIVEALLRAVLEVILELAIKGPGFLIVKWIRPASKASPNGCLVPIVGFTFWLLLGLGVWGLVAIL